MLRYGEDDGKNCCDITWVIKPKIANSYHSNRLPAKQLKRIFLEEGVMGLGFVFLVPLPLWERSLEERVRGT